MAQARKKNNENAKELTEELKGDSVKNENTEAKKKSPDAPKGAPKCFKKWKDCSECRKCIFHKECKVK